MEGQSKSSDDGGTRTGAKASTRRRETSISSGTNHRCVHPVSSLLQSTALAYRFDPLMTVNGTRVGLDKKVMSEYRQDDFAPAPSVSTLKGIYRLRQLEDQPFTLIELKRIIEHDRAWVFS